MYLWVFEIKDGDYNFRFLYNSGQLEGIRMHKTYVARMPDKAGAFLVASRIISGYGGNIVRVNYNKAVDTHTLFIEVSADEKQHRSIEHDLKDSGYLSDADDKSRIMMIVLTLQDRPGAVTPILDILVKHNVNISYMSSQGSS